MTAAAKYYRAQLDAARHGQPPVGQCTATTLRCSDARDYNVALHDCCRGHVRTVVAATVAVLERLGVTFWADYGTLLGSVRNPLTTWADYPWLAQEGRPAGPLAPGIIPHDKDADFGVLWSDWPKVLQARKELEAQGFMVLARGHQGSMKVCLSPTNRSNLDLFSWREAERGMLRRIQYIAVDEFKGRDFPMARIKPMASVEWEGMTLPAPSDPEQFCAFRYGSGWRTPIAANHDGLKR